MLYSNTKLNAVDSIFQHGPKLTKVTILKLDISDISTNLEDWSLPTHVVKLALYGYVLTNGALDMAYTLEAFHHVFSKNIEIKYTLFLQKQVLKTFWIFSSKKSCFLDVDWPAQNVIGKKI